MYRQPSFAPPQDLLAVLAEDEAEDAKLSVVWAQAQGNVVVGVVYAHLDTTDVGS